VNTEDVARPLLQFFQSQTAQGRLCGAMHYRDEEATFLPEVPGVSLEWQGEASD
jgi:hypothetical protein